MRVLTRTLDRVRVSLLWRSRKSSCERMEAEEAQRAAIRTSAHKQPGLQTSNKGRMCVKPRLMRKSSPQVYKIRPEEFLDVVQRLTGQSLPHPPTPSQYFQMKTPSVADKHCESEARYTQSVGQSNHLSSYGEMQAPSSTTSRLLRPSPSPRVADFNFLPLMSSYFCHRKLT